MADPVGTAASVLAVVSAAYSSARTLYELIDGLENAPKAIAEMKIEIAEVQKVLQSLEPTLKEKPATLAPVFTAIEGAASACNVVTEDCTQTIEKYTTHSKDGSFSKRDRLTVTFRKSKLQSFGVRLNASKNTVQLAVTSATFRATSSSTYRSTQDLKAALKEQESLIKSQSEQLIKIEKDIKDLEIDEDAEVDNDNDIIPITIRERDLTLAILPVLQKACDEALAVTLAQANNTVQKFGNVTADDYSKVGGGVAGSNLGSGSVHQEFKDTKAINSSQAFVGRMDSQAFKDFWGSPMRKPNIGLAANAEGEKGELTRLSSNSYR